MRLHQLFFLACSIMVQVAMAQDGQANVPPTQEAEPSPEMAAWLDFLDGSGQQATHKGVPRNVASGSWTYPTTAPTTPFAGGTGTSSDPYRISTPQQLANLSYKVNNGSAYAGCYFQLTNDIALNTGVLKADGSLNSGTYQSWTPIGNSSNSFKGNFNGNGHYVSGIYISTTSDYQGLFGRAADGEISQLGVKDSYIKGGQYVGGLVGHSDHVSLIYCWSAATVSGSFDIGGLVGDDYGGGGSSGTVGSSNIKACANYGLVTATTDCGGGILGYGNTSVNVYYCINYGKITGTGKYIGGIVGQDNSKINSCANIGSITITGEETKYGAICYNSTPTNSYYLVGSCDQAGGGTAKTAAEFADGTVANLLDPAKNYITQGSNGYPVVRQIAQPEVGFDYQNAPSGISVIDLGLPSGTLWANMNVGATSVTDKGSYYGWGGLTPNSTGYSSATTYSQSIDAASVTWGYNWQMPSENQLRELITYCTWTYFSSYEGSGVAGMELTGPSGRKLFLPTTGLSGEANGFGNYWSSTVVSSSQAVSMYFQNGDTNAQIYTTRNKANGQGIRPIYTGPVGQPGVTPTDISALDYAIYTNEAITRKGSQLTLTVNMKNSQPITLWQADLSLPEGFTLATDSYGDPMVSISGSRTSSSRHSIATSTLADGTTRILCSSSSNKTFTGQDGEVATITLNVANSVGDGEYALTFKNIILVETSEAKHEVSEVVSRIKVKNYTLGDVNNDGSIDGVDLVGIVNYILENPTAGNIREAADVNKDGVIDGSDYVREVNAILGRIVLSSPAKAPRKANIPEGDYAIYTSDITAVAGETATMGICMRNAQTVTLWQADLVLPEGVSIATDDFEDPLIAITGRTSSSRHSIATNQLADGSIRILCSSSSNKTFTGNDGEVASITLNVDGNMSSGNYPVVFKNVLIVESNETRHACEQSEATLTVENTLTGIAAASAAGQKPVASYSTSGMMNPQPRKGVNILRMDNGSTVKVVAK